VSPQPARKDPEDSLGSPGLGSGFGEIDEGFVRSVKMNVQKMLLSEDLEMPRMSGLASRILEIASDPTVDVDRIVKLVQADAFLAGKILGLINSAYFATKQEVTSLRHAIVLLGLKAVGDLIFSVSVKLTVFRCPAYDTLMRKLWEHSIGTAVSTEIIGQICGSGGTRAPGFMGGLMHDIGKPIVLSAIVETETQRRTSQHLGQSTAVTLVDRMHVHVGHLLARKWGFSLEIQEAILEHQTWNPNAGKLAQQVYCGNKLAHHLGFGYRDRDLAPNLDPGFAALNLTGDTLEKIKATASEHTTRLIGSF
jgi:HD-like signal output (HDOD) protein